MAGFQSMRKFVMIVVLGAAVAVPALADDVAIDKYTVEITPEMIGIISNGLLELPGKTGLPVLQNLQGQLNKQIAAAQEKAKAETEAKK